LAVRGKGTSSALVNKATAAEWRAPTPTIARVLAPLAVDDDEEVRQTALITLMGLGESAALCADAFAAAVERALVLTASDPIRVRLPPAPESDRVRNLIRSRSW